jgi:hypothetical protein
MGRVTGTSVIGVRRAETGNAPAGLSEYDRIARVGRVDGVKCHPRHWDNLQRRYPVRVHWNTSTAIARTELLP